jgi:hypothetical protein
MLTDTFVFHPDRAMGPPPAGVEEVVFPSQDGVTLSAWWAGPEGPGDPVLVWSHGNAGNISGRGDILQALRSRGLGVLAYDYRGYGRSRGTPSEQGLYRDAEAAHGWVVARGVSASRIVCFGESLGGAVSIHLATVRPCAALVALSTFTRIQDVGQAHVGVLAMVLGRQFDSVSKVGGLGVPKLMAHGDRDEVVPYALGEALFARAAEPKRFLRLPGRGHNDAFTPGLLDEVAAFCREAVGR